MLNEYDRIANQIGYEVAKALEPQRREAFKQALELNLTVAKELEKDLPIDKAFLKIEESIMDLSMSRTSNLVQNLSREGKKSLNMIVSSAIASGASANDVAKQIRSNLKLADGGGYAAMGELSFRRVMS